MNIPNMINTLISEAFDLKPVLSPKNREIPKSPSSKAKIRNFVLPGHSQRKKEATSPFTKSISHHKLSGEYTQKDISPIKNNQSIDQTSHNKTFEAKKETKKSSNIILASFLKNNSLKSSIAHLAGTPIKQPPVETVILDLKTATMKSPSRTSHASPYKKRTSLIPNKELKATSESVSQLHSPKGKNGDFYGHVACGEKEKMEHQQGLKNKSPMMSGNKALPDNDLPMKKVSPKRLKAKDDRTGISEVSYDSKRHFKRKSVYRSRQSSNYTETQDDPSSKLSTNAPSQFSEVRRSFPSQKSQSMIKQNHNETTINDEGKDYNSSRQKVRHNTEIKFNESYDINSNAPKSKQPSMKDKSIVIKVETKSKQTAKNEARSPKSMDGATYGKLLKTFYMQKKNDLSMRKSKILKATSSHVSFLKEDGHLGSFYKEQIKNLFKNNCDIKGIKDRVGLKLDTRMSDPRNNMVLLNMSSNRNITSMNGRELDGDLLYDMKRMSTKNDQGQLRKELRKTKSLSPPKMKIYSEGVSQQGVLGSELFDNGKNISKGEISLRSPMLKEEHKKGKEEHSESSKECSLHTSIYEMKTEETNLSINMNQDKSDGLYRIYQKTRNVLESYRVKENSWTNEKSLLLGHIQNLENRLKIYEDLKD